jgi:hypothetical protein
MTPNCHCIGIAFFLATLPWLLVAPKTDLVEGIPMLEKYFASVEMRDGALHLRTSPIGVRFVVQHGGGNRVTEYGQSFTVETSPVEFKGQDFRLNLVPIQISGVGIIGVKETIDRRSVGGNLETTYAAVPIMPSELPELSLNKVKTLIDKALSDLNLNDQKSQ